MKKLFWLPAILLILGACGKKDQVPSGLIDPEKMEAILWDMIRADQFNLEFVFAKDTNINKKEKSIEWYRQILALHSVDQEKFRESFYYYRAHPGEFKVIMDSISKRSAFELNPTLPRLSVDSIAADPNAIDPLKRGETMQLE